MKIDIVKNKLEETEFKVIGKSEKKREKSSRELFVFQHKKCKKEFITDLYSLLASIKKSNGGCPHCAIERRVKNLSPKVTIDEFVEKILLLPKGNEYKVLSEKYTDNKTKIRFYHEKCGEEFLMRPNDFQQGYRCPHCALMQKESKLAGRGKELLSVYSLIEEKKFEDLKNTKSLSNNPYYRFDLFIESENTLIEFDGEQHFLQKQHRENLEAIRLRDITKNEYAIKNKITILRIPFSEEKNLEKIIEAFKNKNFGKLCQFKVFFHNGNFSAHILDYFEINKTRSCRSKTV